MIVRSLIISRLLFGSSVWTKLRGHGGVIRSIKGGLPKTECDDSPMLDGSNDILFWSVQCRKLWLPLRAGNRECAPQISDKLHGEFSPAGKMDHANALSWWLPAELTHDLGVAETFLRFRETRPTEATLWKGEGIISPLRRKKKVPDAIIAGDFIWPPRLVVEFAGSYSRERIQVFHWFCEKEQLAYELW